MAKLNFKDPAQSSLVNNAFLGRSVDDETTGKLDLSNTDPVSGDSISNLQRVINESRFNLLPNQVQPDGASLSSDSISRFQIIRVSGDVGAVTISGTPFGSSPDIQDGTLIYIIGQSDTNTVKIIHNDVTDGTLLNGDATLKKGYCLQLFYDAGLDRFIDVGRNF